MDKGNEINNYVNMVQKSWTFERLTPKEKNNVLDMLHSELTQNCLRGTYKQRWEILQAIYRSFLMALDYKPIGWREKTDNIPLF